VIEHSGTAYGGNVCATYNKRRKKISIGISDIGSGLLNHLKKYHNVKTDKEAIKLALTPSISGVTKRIGEILKTLVQVCFSLNVLHNQLIIILLFILDHLIIN